jgi:hypothetical protein
MDDTQKKARAVRDLNKATILRHSRPDCTIDDVGEAKSEVLSKKTFHSEPRKKAERNEFVSVCIE